MTEPAGLLNLLLLGGGRMGQHVANLAAGSGFNVVGVVARSPINATIDAAYFQSMDAVDVAVDVVIDFSLPSGTEAAALWCRDHKVPLVTGTTGLHQAVQDVVLQTSKTVPVLQAANFSRGFNTLLALVDALRPMLAGVANPVEPTNDANNAARISISDTHHIHKLDAPSGSAIRLAEHAGVSPDHITSHREGEVIGDHQVEIQLDKEHLVLSHSAEDRAVFALGALQAARWLHKQPPGHYTALDWIGHSAA